MYYLVKAMEKRPGEMYPVRVHVRIHRGSEDVLKQNRYWDAWNKNPENPKRWDEIVARAEGLHEALAEMRRILNGRKS